MWQSTASVSADRHCGNTWSKCYYFNLGINTYFFTNKASKWGRPRVSVSDSQFQLSEPYAESSAEPGERSSWGEIQNISGVHCIVVTAAGKYLKSIYKDDAADLFPVVADCKKEEQQPKTGSISLNIRKTFFTRRLVWHWDSAPVGGNISDLEGWPALWKQSHLEWEAGMDNPNGPFQPTFPCFCFSQTIARDSLRELSIE